MSVRVYVCACVNALPYRYKPLSSKYVCVCARVFDSSGPLRVDAVHSAVPEVFHSGRCLPNNSLKLIC